MKNLTDAAQNRLGKYLRQVRNYLRATKSVDVDEVEQNITGHIENELAGVAEPVSPDALNTVLVKLGSPSHWVPEEEL